MPKFEITAPDGSTYEVNAPEGATEQDAISYVQSNFYKQPTPAENIGGRFGNLIEGVKLGAKAPVVGLGNLSGVVSDEQVSKYKQEVADNANKPGGFGGQVVGGAVPAAGLSFLPGGNTVAGAALYNGLYGAALPAESGSERAANAGVGAAGGAIGQIVGQGIKAVAKPITSAAEDKAAQEAAKNSVRDDAVKSALANGYTLPRSEYNPSFLTNRLESVGGKAAIKQEAVARNQEVTNSFVKKALGIPEDKPLSISALEGVREKAYAPYREIANLPKVADIPDRPANWLMMDAGAKGKKGFDPAKALEDLKQARHDAKAQFDYYNRSANPDALANAKSLSGKAESIESQLEEYAASVGREDLVPQLREARKTIAKTYDVERAINKTTGDVDARVFGRLHAKQKPLSDGLEKVGEFAEGFPKYAGYGPSNPAAGVGKTEAIGGAMLGLGTAAATGSPAGLMAAGIPLLSHPARALALSPLMQKAPIYRPGFLPMIPNSVTRISAPVGGAGLLNYSNSN